jgi:hypothetical protein
MRVGLLVKFPTGQRNFLLLQNSNAGSEAHAALQYVGTSSKEVGAITLITHLKLVLRL